MKLQVGWDITAQIPSVIVEANWQSIKFERTNSSFIPDKRGIYIVSVSTDFFNGVYPFGKFETPAYIGMSTKLRNRFVNHTAGLQDDALWRRLGDAKKRCTFWFTVLSDKSTKELKFLEQALIDCYGSPLNRINSVRLGEKINGKYL